MTDQPQMPESINGSTSVKTMWKELSYREHYQSLVLLFLPWRAKENTLSFLMIFEPSFSSGKLILRQNWHSSPTKSS